MIEHPITAWRKRHSVTQLALAHTAGLHQAAIAKIESRARLNPRLDTIMRIAEATERLRPGRGLTAGQVLGIEPYEPGAGDDPAPGSGYPDGEPESCTAAAGGVW